MRHPGYSAAGAPNVNKDCVRTRRPGAPIVWKTAGSQPSVDGQDPRIHTHKRKSFKSLATAHRLLGFRLSVHRRLGRSLPPLSLAGSEALLAMGTLLNRLSDASSADTPFLSLFDGVVTQLQNRPSNTNFYLAHSPIVMSKQIAALRRT